MLLSYLSLILLLVAILFFSVPLSSGPKSCETLTRAKIQEKFGKPVKCQKGSQDDECFGRELEPVRVQFTSSDVVTRLEIKTYCNGIQPLKAVLDDLVPKDARGKYRQQSQRSPDFSCQRISEEEYECLRITYFQEMCMGCAPASIKVIWK
jgi:hypothetical protein